MNPADHEQKQAQAKAPKPLWVRVLPGLLLVAVMLLAACGPRFNNSNIEVVNQEFTSAEQIGKGGVSPKEVESILGPPTRVENYRLELQTQKKELDGVRYYYDQDGQTIELHFLDGRLISKAPLLNGAKPAAGTPTP